MKVAIVGLGRVGGEFLAEILKRRSKGLHVRCAAELTESPGKQAAREAGIPLLTVDEIIDLGAEIDILFDLSGSVNVRRMLREKLAGAGNHHTVIAPETVSRLIWSLISDSALPEVHSNLGY